MDGTVILEDVLVICTNTDFDPTNDQHWNEIWNGYSGYRREWSSYPGQSESFRDMALALWHDGRLHQPRRFGAWRRRVREHWYDLVPTQSTILERPPAVQEAWNHFQMLSKLTKD
jgi:hypothetical protein